MRMPGGQSLTVARLMADDDVTRPRSRAPERGPSGRTYRQLYEEAKRRDVPGRSSMSKAELERALRR